MSSVRSASRSGVDEAPLLSVGSWLASLARRAPNHASAILGFSLASNILLLVAPLYMLQVYDRVLSSGSVDTLVWLSVIAVFLLAVYAAAEAGRRRVSALAAARLDALMARRIFARFEEGGERGSRLPHDLQHLSRVEGTLQNGGMLPFFDLPFVPLFMAVLFLIHPLLGVLGLAGAALIIVVAVAAEFATRRSGAKASAAHSKSMEFAQGLNRQRSAIVAMGLAPKSFEKWRAVRDESIEHALSAAKGDGTFSAIARSLRQILQIMILGAGAGLALSQQISPGGIVAASIILSRALGPIDQIVGGWRGLVQARSSWSALVDGLADVRADEPYTPLPRPAAVLTIDRLAVAAPGSDTPLVRPFSYEVSGGKAIAIVGGNGAGKTSLLQTLSGAWPPAGGTVSLGGRSLHDWPSEDRGAHIGYVPQDVELSPATVAENISRFQAGRDDEVFDAAQRAGAQDSILGLSEGFDTLIGPGGRLLSAGQRQLIGVARALFGNPLLMLLDEPTANLDANAAEILISALRQVADDGCIVIAATHDPRLISRTDIVLAVRKGAVMAAPSSEYVSPSAQPTNKVAHIKGAAS